MSKQDNFTKNSEILYSVLEFLDRNGYKQSFEKLQQKTGILYHDNDKKVIEDLLHLRQIDELILYVKNNRNISNEEKMTYIKLLKIKKYIELIKENCRDRIDQKDSLYYLRTEITPMLYGSGKTNKNLLNSLTLLLFYKDMNLLEEYIKKNLNEYSNDAYIINELSKNRIIPIEKLYEIYNNISENRKEIFFDKYNVMNVSDLCFENYKTSEIWFLEISKNKKYIAIGFSNCIISLINVNNHKTKNKITFNLYLSFPANENGRKGEISSLCFSNDEKYILVSLTPNLIRIFNILNGEKIKEYNDLYNSRVTSCIYMTNSLNKFLSGGVDKRLLLIDINSNPFLEIGKFCRIKQVLFSEYNNLIIIIPGSISDIIFYDLSRNKTSFKVEMKEEIIYSNISKSDKGRYILINISKSHPKILLYNIEKVKTEDKYHGHTQTTMIIKCSFAGEKDQYIVSGSEDAKIYIWERKSPGTPKYTFEGHWGVVNCAELLFNDVLLSVSDDKILKIWTPLYEENENNKEVLFNKNEKNIFKNKENNFEKEFLEKMDEPLEEVPPEEDNVEESDEEEERAVDIRFEEE